MVKSNSCNSRLELAGTDCEIVETDPEFEVVRKMVNHFEANATKINSTQNLLTINNQTAVASGIDTNPIKPVTVNNHINMPDLASEPPGRISNENTKLESTEDYKLLQSEAKHSNLMAAAEAPSKVCRNKNVDLAFTLVKQQTTLPQSNKSLGINEERKLLKLKDTSETKLVAATAAEDKVKDDSALARESAKEIYSNPQSCGKEQVCQPPEQIIVPVEIHREMDNKLSSFGVNKFAKTTATAAASPLHLPLSTSSSVSSPMDKAVVNKHYVANDKSIYERKRYDDIEFEEFEVYDPTKDFEKIIEEEKRSHHQKQNSTSSKTKNQRSSNACAVKTAARYSSTAIDGNSAETESDCYDSLDDKL